MHPPRISAAMVARGRVVAEPRLSPDGTQVAFVANDAARGKIVVLPAEGGPELVVTSDPAAAAAAAYGGGAFDWTPDGRSIVYTGADRRLHLVAATGGISRRLVDQEGANAPAMSPDGTRVAFVLGGQHVAVTSLTEGGSWPVLLSSGTNDFALDPVWSPDSAWVAWQEWDVPNMPWDGARIARRGADGSGEVEVVAGGDDVQVQQPRYSPTGELTWLSDGRGWLNLPFLHEGFEHGDPSWGPGQRSYAWSPDGRHIAFNRNEQGFGRLCVVDVSSGEVRELGKGVHGGLSWVGGRIAAIRSGARTPTQVVVIDAETGGRTTVARGPVGGIEDALVEPEPVTWPADDGTEIHGRLFNPARDHPLLVWIHGGPTGQWPVTLNLRIAYFVERGWAVLVPDHRGSTGWGRAYTQAMRGRWGDLDVADTAAGMRAAAERGWCDGHRMVPIGGSAGGFTVLLLLARHPDLCAAGVDLFGVADLFDLDETTHRFEKHYLHSIVGPLPEAADRYRERSPVNVAPDIRSPLLILQGLDDEVVPPAQSRAIADKLTALGRTVETHWYEGEGHGWLRPETIEDELARTESFLRRHVLRWR